MSQIESYDLKKGKPHPYHILPPSVWPLLGAFAAGFLAIGALLFMHDVEILGHAVGMKGVYLGFMAVLYVMYRWWKDVIYEAVAEKAHTPQAKTGLRYGMLLFISSEVMFFVAFFWAFFNGSLNPSDAIGGVWPPTNVEAVDAFHLPLLMTLILLLSGCTVTWAHHAIMEGKTPASIQALIITVGLGVVFTLVQVFEYMHTSFPFTSGIYASAFYMATGFHGFHVLVGTVFLFVCLQRAKKGHFKPKDHFGFEAAAWYWHFVDVVWLFLFVSIYWWGNA